jgi:chorismate synthase
MSGSTFGSLYKISTFGESHGGAVGVIVDGVQPGVEISEQEIQHELDRRKPGQSSITTPRKETDEIHIMSGVFNGKTTGTPIMMILYNKDQDPSAYENIKNLFRPGHADFTYLKKYGIRDFRGSGRASGRETAGRVAAGALARKILLSRGISILAYTIKAAGIEAVEFNPDEIEKNMLRSCDSKAAEKMLEVIQSRKEENDSSGGVIECRINGVPPGLGEPVFDKLDALLAHAMLSIGAVKGIEFGMGFKAADMTGSSHNDWMDKNGFKTNNAGGVIGGISTGEEIVFRVPVKPVSSIAREQESVDINGDETVVITEGRHDACICPRIVPVIEAMSAIVIYDLIKRQAALHE